MRRIFCKHKFEQISKVTVWADGDDKSTDIPVCHKFVFMCAECGAVKKISV